jgi:4-hydroxybutyryl-CoA dehydratase / vinylacetyl-CoA-Delta-isomerase
MKLEIYRNYPIGNKVDLVERLLDRGVLADATRKITRNRQPGKCCAIGCFAPDSPQMVALPQPLEKPAALAVASPKAVTAD